MLGFCEWDRADDARSNRGVVERLVSDQVARLTAIMLDDLVEALGWLGRGALRPVVRRAGQRAARAFAEEVAAFDHHVASAGLVEAARSLLARHSGTVLARGHEAVPRGGPVFVVANHPGLTDALALIASLAHDSLLLVAADRAFFQAIPHVARSLVPVPDHEGGRLTTFRAIASRVAEGSLVASFPTGAIEPDPLLHRDAFRSAASWSRQLSALRRRVPRVAIVPAAIGGVLSPKALRHPLVRLYRARADRERVAAMLQVVLPGLKPAAVRVAFGNPLPATEPDTLRSAYDELERALRSDEGWVTVLTGCSQPARSR